jgi:prepilin-type N-terminal cleavage/methylation domain-containing protein
MTRIAAPAPPARRAVPPGVTGFTLVELMIALAIGATLLLMVRSSLHGWISRYYQRNHAQALAEALQLARAEGI